MKKLKDSNLMAKRFTQHCLICFDSLSKFKVDLYLDSRLNSILFGLNISSNIDFTIIEIKYVDPISHWIIRSLSMVMAMRSPSNFFQRRNQCGWREPSSGKGEGMIHGIFNVSSTQLYNFQGPKMLLSHYIKWKQKYIYVCACVCVSMKPINHFPLFRGQYLR